jgi:hypothetical protein
MLWIRLWIRMDPHHLGNLDPDPHPHQLKIRIRIKYKNQDPHPHPHQFADDKPKCLGYEPIFQEFEPLIRS